MTLLRPRHVARARLTRVGAPLLVVALFTACGNMQRNPSNTYTVEEHEVAAEQYIPRDIDHRPDSASLVLPNKRLDTDEEGQLDALPALPEMMTLQTIRDGDAIFHRKGGCYECHGYEGEGLPKRGKTLTAGPHYVPAGDWRALDSLVAVGIRDAQTRSEIAMPARGRHSDLDVAELRAVSAYVWAISQVRGEPWSGGHAYHDTHDWRASARTDIP